MKILFLIKCKGLSCLPPIWGRVATMLLLILRVSFSSQAQDKLWQKTVGGSDTDQLASMQQTSDGGYILGGTSRSNISGDKSEANKGIEDYWIVKLDANRN